jgi:hypothetical protein
MSVEISNKIALALFIALIMTIFVPLSTVASSSSIAYDQSKYFVSSTGSSKIMSPATVYDSVIQGETDWHSNTINTYTTKLTVDLYWGNPSNSLQLTIYSPDGYTFGPYYDGADGTNDGRTHIEISSSSGLTQGTWYYKIYGYSVTGTQSYSI